MSHFLLAYLPHLIAAVLVGLCCIRCIGPRGFMDIPRERRNHERPIPLVGGMAFFLCLAGSRLITQEHLSLTRIGWVLLLVMVVLGILDDRFELRARWKALIGLMIAVALTWANLPIHTANPSEFYLLGLYIPRSPVFLAPLLLAYFWGIPQAINLIDGANGLAIGFSLIITSVLVVAGGFPMYVPAILTGILLLNWPKARLFLGDCGSLGLGLLMAVAAHNFVLPHQLLWLFAYPILDVTLVLMIRVLSGKNPFAGDCNHLHHQLQRSLGSRSWLTVPILWTLSALTASHAIIPAGPWLALPYLGVMVLAILVSVFMLRSLKRAPKEKRRSFMLGEPRSEYGM